MGDERDHPSYYVEHRLVYDQDKDDVLVKRWVPSDALTIDLITHRIRRSTFAHSTRGYPRKTPRDDPREAVIVDHHPTFQVSPVCYSS